MSAATFAEPVVATYGSEDPSAPLVTAPSAIGARTAAYRGPAGRCAARPRI